MVITCPSARATCQKNALAITCLRLLNSKPPQCTVPAYSHLTRHHNGRAGDGLSRNVRGRHAEPKRPGTDLQRFRSRPSPGRLPERITGSNKMTKENAEPDRRIANKQVLLHLTNPPPHQALRGWTEPECARQGCRAQASRDGLAAVPEQTIPGATPQKRTLAHDQITEDHAEPDLQNANAQPAYTQLTRRHGGRPAKKNTHQPQSPRTFSSHKPMCVQSQLSQTHLLPHPLDARSWPTPPNTRP